MDKYCYNIVLLQKTALVLSIIYSGLLCETGVPSWYKLMCCMAYRLALRLYLRNVSRPFAVKDHFLVACSFTIPTLVDRRMLQNLPHASPPWPGWKDCESEAEHMAHWLRRVGFSEVRMCDWLRRTLS